MDNYAQLAHLDVENWVGRNFDTTNIPEQYQGILVNLTACYARARMDGGGVTFSLNGLTVTKGESQQLKFWVEQANQSLQRIGRRVEMAKTFG